MNITELYINGKLCDISENFSVRLNKQLIKPGELNTKDAQYSYSVSLPPTKANQVAFGYANIEEIEGKFATEYSAELIINSARVFSGTFRLYEVSSSGYKGNLYVPAKKSIQDVFGELKLTDAPSYLLQFVDFVDFVSLYNMNALFKPQPAIFPYTLYGLLPKVSTTVAGTYSPKNVWDSTVRIGIQDFPPSLNVIKLLEHLFNSNGYSLGGTALSDVRLNSLYMSYKNDPSYKQPWNFGDLGSMSVRGYWSNIYNMRVGTSVRDFESSWYSYIADNGDITYTCNLFDCNNIRLEIQNDPGGNITSVQRSDVNGKTGIQTLLRIPASGYYKIRLEDATSLHDLGGASYLYNGMIYLSNSGPKTNLLSARTSLKVLRDRGTGNFSLTSSTIDGVFYKNNQNQNDIYDGDNIPKYIPYCDPNRGSIVFVDIAQSDSHVVGFQFGKKSDADVNPNPNVNDTDYSKITAAKPGGSWDATSEGLINYAVTPAPNGYYYYDLAYQAGPGDPPVWGTSIKHQYVINNQPNANYATRSGLTTSGSGRVDTIVWLEEGELLTVVDTADRGELVSGQRKSTGWVAKTSVFLLEVTPFRTDKSWLKINESGRQTGAMNWNDPTNFAAGSIDLIKFLPEDMKVDDFIDNFCKAFNLRLSQVDLTTFELNLKQTETAVSPLYVDLDGITAVRDRVNTPLGLPSLYKVGFTIDPEEEGFVVSGDDGGGEFSTGAVEEKIVEQKSFFSYNWFKSIQKQESTGIVNLPLSVISKSDVWANDMTYQDAMLKKYTNQSIRFWYPDGLLNTLGATFSFNNKSLRIIGVSNSLPGLNILSYHNADGTILDNYFTLLFDGDSCYTEVEGYITPEQYEALSGSITAKFNSDIYYIAEISGYDPTGRNKTKIKLIRKI